MQSTEKPLTERQVRGIQAQVQGAINACTDGAEIVLDLETAHRVVEALRQIRREAVDAAS